MRSSGLLAKGGGGRLLRPGQVEDPGVEVGEQGVEGGGVEGLGVVAADGGRRRPGQGRPGGGQVTVVAGQPGQLRSWCWRPGSASSRGQPLGSRGACSSSAHLARPGTPKLRIGGSSIPARVSAIPAAAAAARSGGTPRWGSRAGSTVAS